MLFQRSLPAVLVALACIEGCSPQSRPQTAESAVKSEIYQGYTNDRILVVEVTNDKSASVSDAERQFCAYVVKPVKSGDGSLLPEGKLKYRASEGSFVWSEFESSVKWHDNSRMFRALLKSGALIATGGLLLAATPATGGFSFVPGATMVAVSFAWVMDTADARVPVSKLNTLQEPETSMYFGFREYMTLIQAFVKAGQKGNQKSIPCAENGSLPVANLRELFPDIVPAGDDLQGEH